MNEKQAQHTAGPFRHDGGGVITTAHGTRYQPFAQVTSLAADCRPDAQFIVRACNSHDELLETLRMLVYRFDQDDTQTIENEIENARAVIAKATGGQS